MMKNKRNSRAAVERFDRKDRKHRRQMNHADRLLRIGAWILLAVTMIVACTSHLFK